MALCISHDHLDAIKAQGEEFYPNECCGFLLGRLEDAEKEVMTTLASENARERKEQYHRFLITPDAYLRCEKIARAQNMDVLGFYHSHPNAEALPSRFDLEHAWPWYSYVIVAVRNKAAKEVTSWVLQDDRSKFNPENIRLV